MGGVDARTRPGGRALTVDRLLLVVGAVALAGTVGTLLGRRPGAPASNTGNVPNLLDRSEFHRPDAPWLLALFSSSTCATCAGVWERTEVLASDQVAVQNLDYQTDAELHRRYGIDGVPTLVIADQDGTVRQAFLGPVTATDLWSALAELREPDST